jgi:stage III sporulation protein SpoIIIAA
MNEALPSYGTDDGSARPPEEGSEAAAPPRALSEEERAEIELLVEALPPRLASAVRDEGLVGLIEVVLDLGRPPAARYTDREVEMEPAEVTALELDHVVGCVSEFGEDNRAGIPRTLHRVSAIRNRRGSIVGLTCRVGRSVTGSAAVIQDLAEDGRSILLLGRPGVGKTTMLRELARILADDLGRRVVIVDTSNEIGGDGDIPHRGIGRARRMQVPRPELQHEVMIEAVENHMPEVVVIDEIGTAREAEAARTIAERGVQLIGTAHGNTLANLMQNPTLSDLIGGIESVTLGDEEARRRGTQKTVLERRAPPTFDALVEIQSFNRIAAHEEIAGTVDALLRGFAAEAELRTLGASGEVESVERVPVRGVDDRSASADRPTGAPAHGRSGPAHPPAPRAAREGAVVVAGEAVPLPPAPGGPRRRILPYGVSRTRLEAAIRTTRSAAVVIDSLRDADAVMTLRPYYRRRSGPLREAEALGVPVLVLRNNTSAQMEQSLLSMRGDGNGTDPTTAALREAEAAIAAVSLRGQRTVELAPQSAYLRRRQHELVSRHGLRSVSKGREPYRRITVLGGDGDAAPLPWKSTAAPPPGPAPAAPGAASDAEDE